MDYSSNTGKDAGRGCACQGKGTAQRLEMIQGKTRQNLAMVLPQGEKVEVNQVSQAWMVSSNTMALISGKIRW